MPLTVERVDESTLPIIPPDQPEINKDTANTPAVMGIIVEGIAQLLKACHPGIRRSARLALVPLTGRYYPAYAQWAAATRRPHW